jgi:signal transduction histidine kinase
MLRLLLILCLIHIILPAWAQDTIPWIRSSDLEKEGYYRNPGFTQNAIRIGIIQDSDTTTPLRYLKINNPHANNIILSRQNGDTIYKTGDFLPFQNRPVYFWDFVLPIDTREWRNDSLVLTIDNTGESQLFFLELLKEQEFEKIKSRDTFMYGGLLAYAIFFAGMFITLGLLKKNRNNIIFGTYVLFSMLWVFNIEGVLYQFLWNQNIFFQHASRVFFSSITIGLFVLYFINYYKRVIHPIARKIFYAFVGFFIIRLLLVLLLPSIRLNTGPKYILQVIGTLIIIAGLILLLVYLVLLFRKKELIYHNLGTAICFIFILKEGLKLTGIDISPFPQQDDYVSVITLVCILTTISVDNIQSYRRQKKKQIQQDLEDSRKKDKEISERILEAQENERSAIGKNIHDQIGGLLAAMKIQLETLKMRGTDIPLSESEKLIRMVDNCSNELYSIVDDLSAPEFQEQNLSFIIQNRIDLYEQSTGICFVFESVPLTIDLSRGLNIYRIVCELIANSIRHAQCQNISLELKKENNAIHIYYFDDGIGFDVDKVNSHHGINNIKSRLGFMNGKLEMKSNSGRTSFTISIPIA